MPFFVYKECSRDACTHKMRIDNPPLVFWGSDGGAYLFASLFDPLKEHKARLFHRLFQRPFRHSGGTLRTGAHQRLQLGLILHQIREPLLNRLQSLGDCLAHRQLEIAVAPTLKFPGDFIRRLTGNGGINLDC